MEEDGADARKSQQNKPKKYCKYNYKFGDFYPGFTHSHKVCAVIHDLPNVPSKMGWLWNANDIPGLKPLRGWRPGAVGKSVAQLMKFRTPRVVQEKKGKKKKPGAAVNLDADDEEEPFVLKPVLKVKRKGDTFTIEVNPLKDLTDIQPNENPFIDCDPMVFKIVKKRSPEEQAAMEARRMVKLKKAREAEIRQKLAEAVEDICKCAYMDVFCNNYDAIDTVINKCPALVEPECICAPESMSSLSSNATWDIEYTPPFGCFDVETLRRHRLVHSETQYIAADAGIPEPCKRCPPCSTCSRCKSCAPSCASLKKVVPCPGDPCQSCCTPVCRSLPCRPKSWPPKPCRCESSTSKTVKKRRRPRVCNPCCM